MGLADGMEDAPGSRRASLAEFAAAKVNLTLEIKGRRPDGYHELESLVMFADFGDRLQFRPGGPLSVTVDGPFAAALGGGDNLIERAAKSYGAVFGGEADGAFHLMKALPVAAGLGGGSADAAAALRLLMRRHGAPEDLAALLPIAREIGADVPCCLYSRAALMTGIGERLHRLERDQEKWNPVFLQNRATSKESRAGQRSCCASTSSGPALGALMPVPALLINPLRPLATRDVFRELAAAPFVEDDGPRAVPQFETVAELLDYAQARHNDLEPPALRLLPDIAEVLAALSAAPGALLCRLSGSGPTCFALFTEMGEAEAAAAIIAAENPQWWIQPVRLS
jgi:4-diphosphocytidyl-2-C-methyl-D-erythritol kinase